MSLYRELPPPVPLSQWVACGWISQGGSTHVLPDGCVDMVWTGDRLIVAGPATRAKQSTAPPDAARVGVRFRVGAAGAALGLPAGELIDANPPAADVWPDGDATAERIAAADTPERALFELTGAVAARLREAPRVDPLVRAVSMELARPRARVRDAAAAAGVSERHLRRRFESSVGYGPKTLARVLRLQRFLALARADPDEGLAGLAAAAGYADQAHLSRDCAALTDRTPGALLAERYGPAGESQLVSSA